MNQDANDLPDNVIDATDQFKEAQEKERRDAELAEVEREAIEGESGLDREIFDTTEVDMNDPEQRKAMIDRVLAEYAKLNDKSVERRMAFAAFFLDVLPADAIVGELIPIGGDVGAAAAMTAYFLAEGGDALSPKDVARISAWQTADAGIGAIPWVGGILDWVISHSNMKSKKIVAKARQLKRTELRSYLVGAGVSEEMLDEVGTNPKQFLAEQQKKEKEAKALANNKSAEDMELPKAA